MTTYLPSVKSHSALNWWARRALIPIGRHVSDRVEVTRRWLSGVMPALLREHTIDVGHVATTDPTRPVSAGRADTMLPPTVRPVGCFTACGQSFGSHRDSVRNHARRIQSQPMGPRIPHPPSGPRHPRPRCGRSSLHRTRDACALALPRLVGRRGLSALPRTMDPPIQAETAWIGGSFGPAWTRTRDLPIMSRLL